VKFFINFSQPTKRKGRSSVNNKKLIIKLGFIGLAAFGLNSYATDIKPTAVLDTNYTYNFNRPGVSTNLVTNPQNSLRYNDRGHNQMNLNEASIGFKKANDPVGFEMSLWAGTQAGVESSDNVYGLIKRANVTYGDPGAWNLTVGKFGFHLGYEESESHNNWNYSRSYAYQLLPKFGLGVHSIIPFSEVFHLHLTLANGADRHTDNNSGKLVGLNLHYGEGRATEFNVGATYSPERDNHNGHHRSSVGLNVRHMYSDNMGIGFAGAYVHGRFEEVRDLSGMTAAEIAAAAALANLTVEDYSKLVAANRWSLALYGMMSFWADHQTALRLELARDSAGAYIKNASNNNLFAGTLSHKYLATANLSFWGELRWDNANRNLFNAHDSRDRKNMWTTTLAATLSL
jgi:hypothetical protein